MKTAVEWLIDMLVTENEITLKGENFKLFEQAKEKERIQMEDNWKEGMKSDNGHFGTFEKYYNKTFKS
jgi:hypothetical protein